MASKWDIVFRIDTSSNGLLKSTRYIYEREVSNLSGDGINRLLKTKVMEQFKKIILSKEKHIEVVARIGRAHPDWHSINEVSKAKIYCLLIMD